MKRIFFILLIVGALILALALSQFNLGSAAIPLGIAAALFAVGFEVEALVFSLACGTVLSLFFANTENFWLALFAAVLGYFVSFQTRALARIYRLILISFSMALAYNLALALLFWGDFDFAFFAGNLLMFLVLACASSILISPLAGKVLRFVSQRGRT